MNDNVTTIEKPERHGYLGVDDNLTDCFIAGGAVLSNMTNNAISDIDVYPKNADGFACAIDVGLTSGQLINLSSRALTFLLFQENVDGRRGVMQVIASNYHPTAESIFKSFDFSVCMCAYDVDTKQYSFADGTLLDIMSATVHYNPGTKYPLASMLRVAKYKEKGFFFPKGEMIKIALSIWNKPSPKSFEEIAEQIGGTYGDVIVNGVNDIDSEGAKGFTMKGAYERCSLYGADDQLESNIDALIELYASVSKIELLLELYDNPSNVRVSPLQEWENKSFNSLGVSLMIKDNNIKYPIYNQDIIKILMRLFKLKTFEEITSE